MMWYLLLQVSHKYLKYTRQVSWHDNIVLDQRFLYQPIVLGFSLVSYDDPHLEGWQYKQTTNVFNIKDAKLPVKHTRRMKIQEESLFSYFVQIS